MQTTEREPEPAVTVGTFETRLEVEVARGCLVSSGIRATIWPETTVRQDGRWPPYMGVELRVPASEAADATGILKQAADYRAQHDE